MKKMFLPVALVLSAAVLISSCTSSDDASSFDTSLLQGKRLINIDMEEEGTFTVSSAGATDVVITIPVVYEDVPDGLTAYTLALKGLSGGHSGPDIDNGMANANILTARLLSTFNDGSIYLWGINGGTAENAIPRECFAVILLPDSAFEKVNAALETALAGFKAESPHDENMTIVFEKTDAPEKTMGADSFENVLAGILLTPNGVCAMSPQIEGLVRTSSNLGVVAVTEKAVTLTYFARSSSFTEEDFLLKKMELSAVAANAAISINKTIPPWEYAEDSPLRDQLVVIFKELYGKEPGIEAVHAGLECAAFAKTLPGVDLISLGPDIIGAHSPDEKMSLSSFSRVCDFMVKALEKL